MMVLKTFWGSLGAIFDDLGGVLETLWVVLRVASGSIGLTWGALEPLLV